LRLPFGGNPLEFGHEIWRQKTRVLGLPDGEEIMTLAFFVLTQYWRVTAGRTDGHVAITITRARCHTRKYLSSSLISFTLDTCQLRQQLVLCT